MNKKLPAAVIVALAVVAYAMLRSDGDSSNKTGDEVAMKTPAPEVTSPVTEEPTLSVAGTASAPTSEPEPAQQSAPVPPETTMAAEESLTPTSVDVSTEEDLARDLRTDEELVKVAEVEAVRCFDGKCTVELEAKGEQSPQMKMLTFLAKHRDEYGRYSRFEEDKDNPRISRFVISKEKL
jgi:hypothetical protein